MKSTPKAALGIGNRIFRLTSETKISLLLWERNLFVTQSIEIIRV